MAILLVILFHYGYLGFGWVGVQLFFVLSGYLITSILVSERGRPLGESLKRFYWRRSLRIVPLYCLYLLALLTTFLFLKVPPALADQWPYLLTYTYNVRHILPDYDGSQFLIHLWSLSVEEQFYLVWPITVLLLAPRRFKFALIGIVILVPLIRLIAALFLLSHGQPQLFVGTVMYTITPFQIDAFATGAIVATFRLEKIRLRKWLLYVGLALAVAMGLASQYTSPVVSSDRAYSLGFPIHLLHHYQYVWGYTVINVLAGLLILGVVGGVGPVGFLKHRIITFIGRISYGIYVYHLGILVIFQRVFPVPDRSLESLVLFVPYLLLTVGVSYLSFRIFESRFLQLKDGKFHRSKGLPAPDQVGVVNMTMRPSKLDSQRTANLVFVPIDPKKQIHIQ